MSPHAEVRTTPRWSFVSGTLAEHIFFDAVNFSQNSTLANGNCGMNRALAILKYRMSLDWLSADFFHQPPGWKSWWRWTTLNRQNYEFAVNRNNQESKRLV